MTESTVDVVKLFLDRLGAQDAEGLEELFADEIDWYVPGSATLPWTGTRSKRTHVAEYFHTMWPAFVRGQSTAEPGTVVVDGADAVVFARFAHTVVATGRRFETPVAFHFTVVDGKITRMHLYEDTLAVSDAFQH